MDDTDAPGSDTKVTQTMDTTPREEREIGCSKTSTDDEILKDESSEHAKDSPLNYEYIYLDSDIDSFNMGDKENSMDTETDAVDQLIDPKSGETGGQCGHMELEEQKIDNGVKDHSDNVEENVSTDIEMKAKVMTEHSSKNNGSDNSVIDKSKTSLLGGSVQNGNNADTASVEIQQIFDKENIVDNTENSEKLADPNKSNIHGTELVDLYEYQTNKQMESETVENISSKINSNAGLLDNTNTEQKDTSTQGGNVKSAIKTIDPNDQVNNNRHSLGLNLQCQSPEDDGRGVSPEIVCLTHLSPTALYGKDQPGVPRILSKYEGLSRPTSLNTPDPVVYGESDSCPTPFLYTSSNGMPNYGQTLYTTNGNQFMETNYVYTMPENPINEENNHLRGQKRKLPETDVNNNQAINTLSDMDRITPDQAINTVSDMDRITPDLFPFSAKGTSFMGQMYHTQGRPPDVSTWTAVNSGPCKYGTGFGESGGQSYGNSFSRDPFLYGYQQQYSECGYNAQMAGQFSSKPTCKVPPYMLNHTQTTDAYSPYSQTVDYDSPQFGSDYNFPITGTSFSSSFLEPGEQARASCQYASNQTIDTNNNIHFGNQNQNIFTSRACCRLDFSSPVTTEQYQLTAFPIPTFVSTHSYLSGLTKPEPLFPNTNPMITGHKRTATCTSTYSRPSSAMSTRSDNGTSTPSIDLTQPSSDEDETAVDGDKEINVDVNNNVSDAHAHATEAQTDMTETRSNIFYTENHATETEKGEIPPDSRKTEVAEGKIENMIVPLRARSTKILCQVKDLASKTLKELIQTAENKAELDGEQFEQCASSSTQSATSPPPAHQNQKVSESFKAEFVKQRRTKSPISAFCAALDLSKPKKNDCRPILPYPNVQPAIPISSLLNINGPTLAYNGSMMVPYLQTLCASNSYLTSKTIADTCNAQKFVSIGPNRLPFTSTVTGSYTNTSQTLNIPNPSTLMNFAPYTAIPLQNLQYFPYLGSGATLPVNPGQTSGQSVPKINLSNIPLPLYQQLPRRLAEQGEQTLKKSQTVAPDSNNNTTNKDIEGKKQLLCNRNIGMAVPVIADIARAAEVNRMETRQRKKKCSASLIPPPPVTIPGYTATIQGSCITTQPSKESVTYHPTPTRLNEALVEPGGKRQTFKARHCNFSVLRIGTFQYTCPTISYEKIARVKILYSKKKLLYEFQLNNLEDTTTPHRRLSEIEVPFDTIVGLWMFEREMRLEVNTPPTMCLGSKVLEKSARSGVLAAPIYDREVLVDLTDGQLRTVPYHYIQFKSCCAEKLKTEMSQFDDRFSLLLKTPLIEDPNKILKLLVIPITSHLLEPTQHTSRSRKGRHKSYSGCRCETGCSSDLCPCCVRGGTCMEGECLCINCRNPLNILHQLGLPVHRARTDPCLMENIYQIKKLECYVKIQLILDCCGIPLTLLQCIPGTFTCPSIGCGTKYTYSWCCAQLCNEDVSPRNHCVKCGRCTDYRNKHCELCNICYFAGESGSFKCPVCHNSLEGDSYGLDSSSESDGYGQ